MALYSEKVMDHFRNPRNVGSIENADGVGEVGNAKCGDIMKIYLKIDNDIITDVKFETFGCGSAIASSSMATEMIKGKPVSEALQLTNKAVAEALDGLPAHKLHCSVLAEEAIKSALKDYYDKNGIAYDAAQFPNWRLSARLRITMIKTASNTIRRNSLRTRIATIARWCKFLADSAKNQQKIKAERLGKSRSAFVVRGGSLVT